MTRAIVLFFAVFFICAGGVSAAPASEANFCQQFAQIQLCSEPGLELPTQVLSEIREIAGLCKQVGGRPLSGPAIEHGHLVSGPEFWTLDEVTLKCEGAWSLFSNAHGWNSAIFVALPDGQIKRFEVVGFGLKSESVASASKLWAAVAGANCGQKDAHSTAEMIGCERELLWHAGSQQLDFAPLSRASFGNAFEQTTQSELMVPKSINTSDPSSGNDRSTTLAGSQVRLGIQSHAPVTRVYTKIDDVRANRYKLCKVVQRSGTDDNPVLEERCPSGPDGWIVSMFSADAREHVRFGHPAEGGKTVPDALEGAFADPNDVIEWRLRDGKPFAAIHRYFLDNRQVLTIHRLQADKTSCVAAIVNVRRGRDANEQAIKIADGLGAGFECGRDSLVVD